MLTLFGAAAPRAIGRLPRGQGTVKLSSCGASKLELKILKLTAYALPSPSELDRTRTK